MREFNLAWAERYPLPESDYIDLVVALFSVESTTNFIAVSFYVTKEGAAHLHTVEPDDLSNEERRDLVDQIEIHLQSPFIDEAKEDARELTYSYQP